MSWELAGVGARAKTYLDEFQQNTRPLVQDLFGDFNGLHDMEAKTGALTDVLHRLSEEVYRKAAAQQEAAQGNGSATQDDTVEDAEYEVIDEDAPKAS